MTVLVGARLRSRDAGRISIFVAAGITALLMVFGVAVDATGQLRTLVRADNLAAEAARAAGQGVDIDTVAESGQHVVTQEQAAQYASEYLAVAGQDQPNLQWSVVPTLDGTAVVINVQITYQHRILGLVNIPDPDVTATATANLVKGP